MAGGGIVAVALEELEDVPPQHLGIIPNDPRLQNAPDPTRVTRSDNRSERQDTGDPSGSRALRYDSNFLTFLQRMRRREKKSWRTVYFLAASCR